MTTISSRWRGRMAILLIAGAIGPACATGRAGDAASERAASCMSPGECGWNGDPCLVPSCIDGRCALEPALVGTAPNEVQVPGDCHEAYCDGRGHLLRQNRDDDAPLDDPNPCTYAACEGGQVTHPPRELGTPCQEEGICNGKGRCGTCYPGTKRCEGAATTLCNEDGAWTPPAPCAASTPICKQAACIGIASIDVGDASACARLEDGTVRCWGDDTLGQLGDRARPTPLPASGAVEIALGQSHACARLDGGRVRCWGKSSDGELGDGTSEDRPTTSAADTLAHVAQIAAGAHHSCARLEDETVRCWGQNERGQLGRSEPAKPAKARPATPPQEESRGPLRATPVEVPALTTSELVLGYAQACAKQRGGFVCWGAPRADESSTAPSIARGTTSIAAAAKPQGSAKPGAQKPTSKPKRKNDAVPAAVKGLEDIVEVALGEAHSCARTKDGHVACWGANDEGELGDGTLLDHATPSRVDGLENVVEIAVGARHGCARITDGSVRCWGRGAEGQLGSATSEVRSTPALVDGVTNATSLRAGGTQTCALTRAGQVLCWGAGSALHAIAW
jgi:hypothetical protein